jgi:hypothetical protein
MYTILWSMQWDMSAPLPPHPLSLNLSCILFTIKQGYLRSKGPILSIYLSIYLTFSLSFLTDSQLSCILFTISKGPIYIIYLSISHFPCLSFHDRTGLYLTFSLSFFRVAGAWQELHRQDAYPLPVVDGHQRAGVQRGRAKAEDGMVDSSMSLCFRLSKMLCFLSCGRIEGGKMVRPWSLLLFSNRLWHPVVLCNGSLNLWILTFEHLNVFETQGMSGVDKTFFDANNAQVLIWIFECYIWMLECLKWLYVWMFGSVKIRCVWCINLHSRISNIRINPMFDRRAAAWIHRSVRSIY